MTVLSEDLLPNQARMAPLSLYFRLTIGTPSCFWHRCYQKFVLSAALADAEGCESGGIAPKNADNAEGEICATTRESLEGYERVT